LNCFAYSPDGYRHGYYNNCKATINEKCPGEKCPFYRTPEQAQELRRKANARLASLDKTTQRYIAEKYYNGRMPWRESDENHYRRTTA
jgi:hypothetical protein